MATRLPTPDWVRTLVRGLLDDWCRVYGNLHGHDRWARRSWGVHTLGAVTYRDFCWEECEAHRETPSYDGACLCCQRMHAPNFVLTDDPDGIAVWWYKNPVRALETNAVYTPEQWIAWHDRIQAALAAVRR